MHAGKMNRHLVWLGILLALSLASSCGKRERNLAVFPIAVDDKCYAIDPSGGRVSKIYDQFYPNYKGEVVMIGDAGVCVFRKNAYTDLDAHPPVEQIQNARFLKGGIVAYATLDGIQFYLNGKLVSDLR